jgi:hypothetical protein
MTRGRWLIAAGIAVIALTVVFAMIGLDASDKLATVVAALTGVVGLAISMIGLRDHRKAASAPHDVSISRSGAINIRGEGHGAANTGYIGPQNGKVDLQQTGGIDRDSAEGDSNTGYRRT